MQEYYLMEVRVQPEESETALGLLARHDIVQVMIEDRRDIEQFEIPEGHWARMDEKLLENMPEDVRISTYFDKNEENMRLLEAASSDFSRELPDAHFSIKVEALGDFQNSWKDVHTVVYAGQRFVIHPPWEECPEAEGRFAIEIDPGMAFGTGSHATTVLCLELLEDTVRKGLLVADIGTGSGILAIACTMLGSEVIATDIDEDCVREAKRNAEVNGQTNIRFAQGDLLEALREDVDVMIANIIDDAILAILPVAKQRLRKGGIFIGSGIEEDRWPEISAMLCAQGYGEVTLRQSDGWCAFRAVYA